MILATDVHYHAQGATAAGVLFQSWSDAEPQRLITVQIDEVKPYVSGQFYQRELPCLLALLDKIDTSLDCIVVDGFVYLDGHGKAGLGKYLYDSLGSKINVVGVAKAAFKETSGDVEVYRGESKKPLYVTAEGLDLVTAKTHIANMHGKFRLPTLLKRADLLCRQTTF